MVINGDNNAGIPIKWKRQAFNQDVRPVLTYRAKTPYTYENINEVTQGRLGKNLCDCENFMYIYLPL